MNVEMRRMNLTGLSSQKRAQVREIMVEALSKVDPCSRPELATEYAQTIDLIDQIEARDD